MFNFWWLARLVDGLKPHPPPISSQKNEMLIFGLCSTSDDWPGWSMDSNPICHPSPAKKLKCSFLDYVQLCWSARLVDGLKPCLPPISGQKNKMLIFWLRSTSDDEPGWSMDSNPHPPPLSSQKNKMLVFALRSTSHDRPGWLMDSNLICHLLPAKKIKCPFLDYVQIVMIGRAGWWTWTLSTTPLQPKKIKCSFLDYIQIVMISRAGWWTQTLSATPLQEKK